SSDNFYYIIKTTNGGDTWEPNLILSYGFINSIFFTDAFTGYYVTGSGMGKTTNGGQNWLGQNCFSQSSLSVIVFTSPNTGFVAGGKGIIGKTTDGGGVLVGQNNIGDILSNIYSIFQNYPNPFNPVTNIKFDIPKRSNVKISIYDILGKEISVLVNEEMNPGTFEVNWDASNFPSGVYFYKIVTDNYSESRKMVLIK
ncbi:MAG: T9SS type A sorting domain-containing protein, partial [Ignavibacteria bacterium]